MTTNQRTSLRLCYKYFKLFIKDTVIVIRQTFKAMNYENHYNNKIKMKQEYERMIQHYE